MKKERKENLVISFITSVIKERVSLGLISVMKVKKIPRNILVKHDRYLHLTPFGWFKIPDITKR